MAIKETNFTLDLTREGKYPVVKFRLNDNKVQKITFRLTNDGRDVDLEKEMGDQFKPVFECIFRDKTFKRDENKNNWSIKREGKLYTFTYYLTNEVIDQSGIACYYFALETPEGLRISTPTLKMVIDCDFKEDGKPSDNYVSDFEKLWEEAKKIKDRIDYMEEEFQKVIEEGGVTPEVIDARDGHKSLKERLIADAKRVAGVSEQIELRAKQSELIGKFYKLLSTKEFVNICLFGDSIMYGADYNSADKRPPLSGTTDNGVSFTDTRASTTPTEALQSYFNQLYNKVTVTQKAFPGDGTKLGYEHWNASGANLVIFNFGINDATREGTGYAGDLTTYIKYYRLLIERELRNGTAVVILTPTRQRLVTQNYSRETVDAFSSAARSIAHDYNIPVIDGAELLNNYNADIYSDYTHHTGTGCQIFASRIAAALLGKGVNRPFRVNSGSIMVTTPQGSSIAVKGGVWENNSGSPTPGDVLSTQGLSYQIGNNGMLTWSFYAEQDALVAIPTVQVKDKSTEFNVKVSLDFGTVQAQWGNYWELNDVGGVNPNYREPSVVTLGNSDFKGYGGVVYGKYILESTDQKVLKITNKGWHTVSIQFSSSEDNKLFINNLSFMSLDDYKNRTYTKIKLEYLSGRPINNDTEHLHLIITNKGKAKLIGTVRDAVISNTEPFAKIDQLYSPRYNINFVCGVSNSVSLTQANILIKPDGNVFLLYSSSPSKAAILEGCDWYYGRYS